MLDRLRVAGFDVHFESHAAAILEGDFPSALIEIEDVLGEVKIPISEIIGSGGGETKGTQRLRRALTERGWRKGQFEIKKTINGVERESVSHEVDHVKSFTGPFSGAKCIALEIEWNNKDPFFDRDLENFKRLHAEGAISAGVIVTRGTSLQEEIWNFVHRFAVEQKLSCFEDILRIGLNPTKRQQQEVHERTGRERKPLDFVVAWTDQFVSDKFGLATTHWRKLMDRVARGVGNPCPLLLVGLPASIVSFEG